MSRAWLTPDELPGSLTCVRLFVPDGEAYSAAARGALLELSKEWNWEQHGTQLPDDVAALWRYANYETFKWEACMPIGTVIYGAWDVAPDGYLLCDGTSYSTLDFPELYAVTGYKFGGSGESFNVPDLRDTFSVGATGGSIGIGYVGGSATVALTVPNMPNHYHGLTGLNLRPVASGSGAIALGVVGGSPYGTDGTGSGSPHENMPPYVGLNAAISWR